MRRFVLAGFLVVGLFPGAALADAIGDNTLCYEQFRSGNDKSAISYCTKAIESGQLAKEDLVAALINRGVAYRNLGDSKRSIVDYTEALKYAPNDGMIYANRSNALRDLGENKRALEDGDKAVKLDKYRAASFFVRGAAYEALNEYDPARRDYMQALTLEPGNRDYQDHVFALDAKRARKAQQGGGAK
ncbi:tetratricopeptide repeat protein [Parvibaculum sedimenti]|uniref:Tetratricopeptide repeat protein n=1 Tax=Parvibaculum sedimenti TaxID=2608632 RepID=A0A6N6VJ12_9HYPH|nr:tetratricopeptide repeat protein [Parvibaculum sedimenti]KAB7740452.1 tetratricopeptide repeat protein [Parvibaculum sedimenti]